VCLFAVSTDKDQRGSRRSESKCVRVWEPGQCCVCACASDLQSLPAQEEEGVGPETMGTN